MRVSLGMFLVWMALLAFAWAAFGLSGLILAAVAGFCLTAPFSGATVFDRARFWRRGNGKWS